MGCAYITMYYYNNILWAASCQVRSITPVIFAVFISYFYPGSSVNVLHSPIPYMSHVSAFHRNFTLKGSLHLPNPGAANPDVVIPRYRMKVELTDQCSYGLQYIGHGKISADAHAVSNTKWDKEPTAVRLLFS